MTYLSIGANTDIDTKTLIQSINCTFGRTSITNQPQAAVFRCTFIVGPGESIYPVNINDQVQYSIYDPTVTGVNKRLVFLGRVSDVDVTLNWQNGQGLYEYSITAIDGLAQLNSWLIGGSGYAKDYEGNRIKAILQEAYPSIDVTGIESPGAYEIAVYNSGKTDALSLCQEAAQSAMGTFFWQHNANRLKYVSYNTRNSATPVMLTTADVLAGDFRVSIGTTTVCNSVTVAYATGNSTTYTDTDSKNLYGLKAGTRSTTLHNLSDANSQAQIFLATRKDPSANLSSLTVNLALVSDALRGQLAQVEVGTFIGIENLPTAELQSFYGYVEGYTWTAARGQDILQMTLSSKEQQYAYTLWNQLNNTDTWNTYALATTTWNDIG